MATIGILQQRSTQRVSLEAEQLQQALSSRVVIEQAKGVLAEFGGVGMETAFDSLRTYSRSRNLKISEVAHDLVQRTLGPEAILSRRPAGS